MFAFMGLGTQEILLLGIIGAMGVGAVVVALVLSKSSGGSSKRIAELEEENRRLREDRDRGPAT